MKLLYLAHRYRAPTFRARLRNLWRASLHAYQLTDLRAGVICWAPWVAFTVLPERWAWRCIPWCIRRSDALILDHDGEPESAGMTSEAFMARRFGLRVEVRAC